MSYTVSTTTTTTTILFCKLVVVMIDWYGCLSCYSSFFFLTVLFHCLDNTLQVNTIMVLAARNKNNVHASQTHPTPPFLFFLFFLVFSLNQEHSTPLRHPPVMNF